MAVPAFNFHTEELVQFSFELRLDNLGKILQEMATAVQNCTKKCAELGSEVFQLRKQIQTQQERTREGLLQEEVSRERVRGQVEKLKDEMRRMETSFITVKEFDNRIRILHQNHQTLSDRLTETETTGGKKIISHIESFVRRHVREWYEPVRADEVKDLLSRLADLQQNVTSSFRSESAQLDDRLSMHINEVQDRAMVDVASANSARERAVATIQQTRDQDMQQVNASIRTVDETQRKNLKEVQQKAHERFTEVEVRVSALYHGQCFDEEDFREIYDEHVKFRQAPGCEGGLHELVDRRVDVLHNTRPFLELRAKVQRDIGHRLNQVKEEDQDDFARQITEIQRELRAKVSAQRVREIVEENTDRSLYESVDYVKARVQIIDDDKVSHATFIEALRSKGDTKALEQKADRVVVTQLFDFLRNRVDGLAKQPAAGWGEPAYDLQEDQEERQKPQPQQRALPLQLTEGPPTEDSTLAVRLVESAENPQSSALASLLPQPPQPRPPPPPPPAPPQQSPAAHTKDGSHRIGIIDAALNPKPDYQWSSEASQRLGMAPSVPRTASRNFDSRFPHASQALRKAASSGADRRPTETPRGMRTADQSVNADTLPSIAEGGGTRAQEAYNRAVRDPDAPISPVQAALSDGSHFAAASQRRHK